MSHPRTTPPLLVAALVSTAVLAAGAASMQGPSTALAATPACTRPLLDDAQPLRRALGPLSDAEVAARNATSVPVLRAAAADDALWLDRCARLVAITPRGTTVDEHRARVATPAPTTDVRALHSRPGARTVLHLDVDGRVLTGSSPWLVLHGRHRLALEAFAADPRTSVTDRETTVRLWRAVAAALADRDVDVTTAPLGDQPASGRALDVVVSRGGDLTASGCACTSMTYLDLPASQAAEHPALVLARGDDDGDAVARAVVTAATRMLDPLTAPRSATGPVPGDPATGGPSLRRRGTRRPR